MVKILFNKKAEPDTKLNLSLAGRTLTASIPSDENNRTASSGFDTIDSLSPYNSYAFMCMPKSKVKVYRKMHSSDYQFLNLNRLGVSIKLDFARLEQLFGTNNLFQVDTGMISQQECDIIIRIFSVKKENVTISSDKEYLTGEFNSDDLVTGTHPRFLLWDSYALATNDNEWHGNCKGIYIDEPETISVKPTDGKDYIDFTIKKMKGNFEKDAYLTRDIDDDIVTVDSSAGVVNTKRVMLENGVGHFRLYPLGYTGIFKLKLGRKWYEVWNEYNLIMEENA